MSPIITSGMILQLLVGAKMIDVNMQSKEDRELYQAANKLFALLITFGEAVAYLLSGMYGPVGELGLINSLLFIATNICELILWKSFSPVTIRTDQGTEFEGAVIATFHFLIQKRNWYALQQSFYRQNAP